MAYEKMSEEKHIRAPKPSRLNLTPTPATPHPTHSLLNLQHQAGNRAVQRLIAQRKGAGAFEVDEAIEKRINQKRGSGQVLDGGMQQRMAQATGMDYSSVNVHTDQEADQLSRQLGAVAFTTGEDVFFQQGTYNPQTSSGQELLAHELTHVAQQRSGAVNHASGRMMVNEPGDSFEQQADSVANHMAASNTPAPHIQRQEMPEDEELQTKRDLQRQEMPEDEELQTKQDIQRSLNVDEEEEPVEAITTPEAPKPIKPTPTPENPAPPTDKSAPTENSAQQAEQNTSASTSAEQQAEQNQTNENRETAPEKEKEEGAAEQNQASETDSGRAEQTASTEPEKDKKEDEMKALAEQNASSEKKDKDELRY